MTQVPNKKIVWYITSFDENVTPSNNLVSVVWPDGYKLHFLVDAGLSVGKTSDNFVLHYRPEKIELVLITHPHIDHIGLLAYLISNGLNAPIYVTEGTALLFSNLFSNSCDIVLRQYKKANRNNSPYKKVRHEKNKQKVNGSKKKQKPPFSKDDIKFCIENVVHNTVKYDVEYEYSDRIKFTFIHNQHIFGAASIMVRLTDPSGEADDVLLFFSGDYNNKNNFIQSFPLPEHIKPGEVSAMLVESTYGNRLSKETNYNFEKYLLMSLEKFCNIIFFTFSLGRTQDIMLLLRKAQDKGIIPKDVELFLDGSLAISNSFIVKENPETFFIKEDARDFFPKDLRFLSKDDRQLRTFSAKQKIIITSSGNGSFGPANQYIRWLVSDKSTCFIFSGFCTKDSLGHLLMNTPTGETIKIFGCEYIKNASTLFLEECSGHGRQDDLIAYINQILPYSVLINHGETSTQQIMKAAVKKEVNPPGDVYITTPCLTFKGSKYGVEQVIYSEPLLLDKKTKHQKKPS